MKRIQVTWSSIQASKRKQKVVGKILTHSFVQGQSRALWEITPLQ